MTIKIINLLIALKTASIQKQLTANVAFSQTNYLVLKLLYNEGFIQSFSVKLGPKTHYFSVSLRYSLNKSVLSNLRIISKPSLLRYLNYVDICKLSSNIFFAAVSTDKKFISLHDCKQYRLGGQILFICS